MVAVVLAAALVLAGCGGAKPPAQEPGGSGEPVPDVVWTITTTDFAFKTDPEKLTAKVGQTVKISLENKGAVEHDFTVHDLEAKVLSGGHDSKDLPPVYVYAPAGKAAEMLFVPGKAGKYKVTCTVPGHEQLGMVMEVTIE